MNQYNIWNKWSKLKTVMLGDNYSSNFFKDIKNNRIRSALQRIADETQEDLENYEKVLKDFGCNVLRPALDDNDSIMNYINNEGAVAGSVPRSPLQPRDAQLVIGNNLYRTHIDHNAITKVFNNYNSSDIVAWVDRHTTDIRFWSEDRWNQLAGDSWGTYNEYKNDIDFFEKLPIEIYKEIMLYHKISGEKNLLVQAPSLTLVGRDLYVDCKDNNFYQFQTQSILDNVSNIRVNTLNHGGHSDGCFHTIKPGAILSILDIQNYKHTFPGWDICYLPGESWGKVSGFTKLKKQVGGKWWVPGEEENDEFTHFVETWLQDWVGYVEESVFDVNVLVLDEHHVCVNNMNPTVIEFLKKHRMEPVHVPWRHRYFWDGGLHCITLDLEREGSQEDYFPERDNIGIIDHGFD